MSCMGLVRQTAHDDQGAHVGCKIVFAFANGVHLYLESSVVTFCNSDIDATL